MLILLLAAACAQCVAQCSDTGRGVPPCHRQHQPKSSVLCQVPVLLGKDTPAQMPVDLVTGPAPVLFDHYEILTAETSDTPTLRARSSTVLRI